MASFLTIVALLVLVQDDQRGNHARHPTAEGEYQHNQHRAATAVDDRKGWKEDS